MPDNITDQQQKRQRRRFANRIGWIALSNVALAVVVYIILTKYLRNWGWGSSLSRMIVIMPFCYLLHFILRRRLIKRLAMEGVTAEQFARENYDSFHNNELLEAILKEKIKLSYQPQLLRASAKAEDATLLRAAAYTNATPQDQLLRPSQNPPAE